MVYASRELNPTAEPLSEQRSSTLAALGQGAQ